MFRRVSPSVTRGVYPRLLCLCESTAARVIQIRESRKSIAMRSLQQSVLRRKKERERVWGSERGGGGYC